MEADEVDIAAPNFGCTYGRSKVALCPPAVAYYPLYFFSRYPQETTRLWNLKNLLTPALWFAYLMTIISIIICFKFFCHVGRKLGLKSGTEEIVLVPFRLRCFLHRIDKLINIYILVFFILEFPLQTNLI